MFRKILQTKARGHPVKKLFSIETVQWNFIERQGFIYSCRGKNWPVAIKKA
jgi:hypothetical protein